MAMFSSVPAPGIQGLLRWKLVSGEGKEARNRSDDESYSPHSPARLLKTINNNGSATGRRRAWKKMAMPPARQAAGELEG